MNWPNLISICRVLAVPLFVYFLWYRHPEAAFLTYVAAGLSDALDGLLARVLHQRTVLGTFLDPMADKFMAVTSFAAGAILGMVPPWLTIIVISRDVTLSLGALVTYFIAGELKIAPLPAGKVTTFLQFATISSVLGQQMLNLPPALISLLFMATALFTVVSGLQYIHAGLKAVGSIS